MRMESHFVRMSKFELDHHVCSVAYLLHVGNDLIALLVARPRRGACHAVTEGRAPRGRRCPRRTGRAVCRARRRRVATSGARLASPVVDEVQAVGAVVAGSTRVGVRALQISTENSVQYLYTEHGSCAHKVQERNKLGRNAEQRQATHEVCM